MTIRSRRNLRSPGASVLSCGCSGALAAGGNRAVCAEALRAYARYRKLFADELGVAPSAQLEAIVGAIAGRERVGASA